jgi:hypothetical protein
MLGAEGDKPVGKSGQRKGKAEQSGKKGEPRKRKENQARAPKPDQLLEALERVSNQVEEQVSPPIPEEINTPVVSAEAPATEPFLLEGATPLPETATALPETATLTPLPETETSLPETETSLPEMSPTVAAEPTETAPVSLQTLANAYSDYSRKSFEQTSSFVVKLACARTFDKAIELQTAFVREAYETFVTESRRIRELYGQLAKQRLARLENLATGMTQGALSPTRKA